MVFQATREQTRIDLPPVEERPSDHGIKIRPVPKFAFLYPTFIMTLVMIVISAWFPGAEQAATWIFLAVVFLNFQVIGTDLSALVAVAIVLGGGLLVALLALAGVDLGRTLVVGDWLKPRATTDFYIVLAIAMAVVFAQILLISMRLDYWIVMPNRILHMHGLRDRVDMLPAPNGVVQKDISDALEFFLLRSGRLMIRPEHGEDVILENVPRINKVERRLLEMMEALDTRIVPPNHHHDY
jgi:hypothetical protein